VNPSLHNDLGLAACPMTLASACASHKESPTPYFVNWGDTSLFNVGVDARWIIMSLSLRLPGGAPHART
jgi:hypothetical protein